MLKNALIQARIHLLAFRNSCILSNIVLKAKIITTAIYTTSLKALSFVLGGLNKVFKLVTIGVRVLSVALLTNPIGLILGGIAIVAGLIIANWDKVKTWFISFIEWLKPIFDPIINIFKGVWQGISDFFYSIFGGIFEYFSEKLSWISKAISSVGGFIKDALGFFGFNDNDEIKISKTEQTKEKLINTYAFESPQTKSNTSLNASSNFNNGNINVSVNGTFNIATENGNFNMSEFAAAVQKSVFDALKKQEQNKINTTIYG